MGQMDVDNHHRKLCAEFDEAMVEIYRRALAEANYTATRFLQMINDHGGLETAKILLRAQGVSEGYSALCLRGRLDLTVEAVIHDNTRWHPLFTAEELAICSERLAKFNYLKADRAG